MKSPIFSRGGALSTTTTRYYPLASPGGQVNNTVVTNAESVMPCDGTITAFAAGVTAAPGSGKNWACKLYKNGSVVATLTVADLATDAIDTGLSLAFTTGDRFAFGVTPTGTPAGASPDWSVEVDCAGQPLISNQSEGHTEPGTTYLGLQNSQAMATPPPGGVIPTDGAISKLYLRANSAPGSGNSWTATLVKNGSDTTLTTTVGAAATTNQDVTHSVDVAPGDLVYWRIDTTGDPAGAGIIKLAAVFTPDADGESIHTQSSNATLPAASARHTQPEGGLGLASSTAEGSANATMPANGYVARILYGYLASAPGAGTSRTLQLRKNSAFPSPNQTMTWGAAETGVKSDGDPDITYDASEALTVHWGVTGTAVMSTSGTGLVLYKEPVGDTVKVNVAGVAVSKPVYINVGGVAVPKPRTVKP